MRTKADVVDRFEFMDSGPRSSRAMTGALTAQLICPSGCFEILASSPSRKNILFFRNANHRYILNRPVPKEGRCATSRNAGRDAVDADGAVDDGAYLRTEKACGPDIPTLVSSSR
jgi:hypothetical protein